MSGWSGKSAMLGEDGGGRGGVGGLVGGGGVTMRVECGWRRVGSGGGMWPVGW